MLSLWVIRQDCPIASSHLTHSRVVYTKITSLGAIFYRRFPCLYVIFFAGKNHFSIFRYCRANLDETHVSIRLLKEIELLSHAADLMFYFLVSCQLLIVFCRMDPFQITFYYLSSLLAAIGRKTFSGDFRVIPSWMFRWQNAAQEQQIYLRDRHSSSKFKQLYLL